MKPRVLVFTDLDGTLLDHHTYEPGPAGAALRGMVRAGVDVYFCSAKTIAEQEHLAVSLGVTVGFIAENGGVLKAPEATRAEMVGVPYSHIRRVLGVLRDELGIGFSGYGDMTVAAIARATGLGPQQAANARARSCTETIVDLTIEEADRLRPYLLAAGLRLQRGARYWTVQGGHDKGGAVGSIMSRIGMPAVSYGIGDAANDLEMLRSVDHPFLVQSPDGSWAESEVPGLTRVEGVGPQGWVLAAKSIAAAMS